MLIDQTSKANFTTLPVKCQQSWHS